jgi:hypothetical protein
MMTLMALPCILPTDLCISPSVSPKGPFSAKLKRKAIWGQGSTLGTEMLWAGFGPNL